MELGEDVRTSKETQWGTTGEKVEKSIVRMRVLDWGQNSDRSL